MHRRPRHFGIFAFDCSRISRCSRIERCHTLFVVEMIFQADVKRSVREAPKVLGSPAPTLYCLTHRPWRNGNFGRIRAVSDQRRSNRPFHLWRNAANWLGVAFFAAKAATSGSIRIAGEKHFEWPRHRHSVRAGNCRSGLSLFVVKHEHAGSTADIHATFDFQGDKRFANGRSTHVELFGEDTFRRQSLSRLVLSGVDQPADLVRYLAVGGCRSIRLA